VLWLVDNSRLCHHAQKLLDTSAVDGVDLADVSGLLRGTEHAPNFPPGTAAANCFSIVGSEQVFCLACPTPATRDRLLSAVTTFCRFASLQRRAEEAEARRQGTV
jgi:hypothetical protein